MSRDVDNDILIPIEVTGLLDAECITDWPSAVEQLAKVLVGRAPSSITNVVVGPNQPSESQRDSVWFKTSNSSLFLGIYVFSDGAWTQVYPAKFVTYTPEITALAPMVIGAVDSLKAEYTKEGERIEFLIEAAVTLSGTASTSVRIKFPPFVRNLGNAFSVNLSTGGAQTPAFISIVDDENLEIQLQSGDPFTLGTCSFAITGVYKTLQ